MERDSQITQEINPREVVLACLEKERTVLLTTPDQGMKMEVRARIDGLLDELGKLSVRGITDEQSA